MHKSIIHKTLVIILLNYYKLPRLAFQYKRGAMKHEHVFSSLCS